MASPTNTRRSEEHTSELQSRENLVCRLLLEKKKRTHPFTQTEIHDGNHIHQLNGYQPQRGYGRNRVAQSLCGFHHFFFNDTATTEIYTLSLHDALPILWAANLVTSARLPSGVIARDATSSS